MGEGGRRRVGRGGGGRGEGVGEGRLGRISSFSFDSETKLQTRENGVSRLVLGLKTKLSIMTLEPYPCACVYKMCRRGVGDMWEKCGRGVGQVWER